MAIRKYERRPGKLQRAFLGMTVLAIGLSVAQPAGAEETPLDGNEVRDLIVGKSVEHKTPRHPFVVDYLTDGTIYFGDTIPDAPHDAGAFYEIGPDGNVCLQPTRSSSRHSLISPWPMGFTIRIRPRERSNTAKP